MLTAVCCYRKASVQNKSMTLHCRQRQYLRGFGRQRKPTERISYGDKSIGTGYRRYFDQFQKGSYARHEGGDTGDDEEGA